MPSAAAPKHNALATQSPRPCPRSPSPRRRLDARRGRAPRYTPTAGDDSDYSDSDDVPFAQLLAHLARQTAAAPKHNAAATQSPRPRPRSPSPRPEAAPLGTRRRPATTAAARKPSAPAPPRNKFTAEPTQPYKFDARVLLNTEQPGAQSRLVWTPWAAFTSQTELGIALRTGQSHVSERIRDADYLCFTSTSTDDASDSDYLMFWPLHPEDYDDVRKFIDEAHLPGEETVHKPGLSDPGSDDD